MIDNYKHFFFLPLVGIEPLELAQRFRASMGPAVEQKCQAPDHVAEAFYFASIVAKAFGHTAVGKKVARGEGFEPNSMAAIEYFIQRWYLGGFTTPPTLDFIKDVMDDLKRASTPCAQEGVRACESLLNLAGYPYLTGAYETFSATFSRIRLHGLAPSPQQQPTPFQGATPSAPAEGSFVKRKPESKVREEMAPQSINLPKSDVAKLSALREEAESVGCEVPTLAEIVRSLLSKAVDKVEHELAVAKASSNASSFCPRPRDLPPSHVAGVDESPRHPGAADMNERIFSLLPEDYRNMLRSIAVELDLDPEGPEILNLALNYLEQKRNSGSPFDKAYFGRAPGSVFYTPEMPVGDPSLGSVTFLSERVPAADKAYDGAVAAPVNAMNINIVSGPVLGHPLIVPAGGHFVADKTYDGTVAAASGSLSGTDADNDSKSFDGHVATGK